MDAGASERAGIHGVSSLRPPDLAAEGLEGDCVWLGAAAAAGVEAVDRGELVGGQFEVEHVDVLCDAAGVVDFGMTERPCCSPQRSITWAGVLPWAVAMSAIDRVLEGAAGATVAVEGDAADRRPRLREDPAQGAELLHVSLLEVGVALDLVDRRHHRGVIEKRREVLDHEVADPDRADLALSEQSLQGR